MVSNRSRSRRGFALVAVMSISFVLLLMTSALFVQAGATRRDGIEMRASTDTLYAAEAGLQTLIAKLNEQNFGLSAVALSSLVLNGTQFIAGTNLTQARVAADAAGSVLATGSAYVPTGGSASGATPQSLGTGTGLGYMVYKLTAYDGSGNVLTPTFPLSTSVGRIDVEVIGFKGRTASTAIAASIYPAGSNGFFSSYPNGIVTNGGGQSGTGNAATDSGKPFLHNGLIEYVKSICQSGNTFTLSSALTCQSGQTKVTTASASLLSALAGQGYSPSYPVGMTTAQRGSYNWVPAGDQGNISAIWDSGSPSPLVSMSGNSTINGNATTYGCTPAGNGSNCLSGGTVTGTSQYQSSISLPPAPTPPSTSATIAAVTNSTDILNGTLSSSTPTCSNTPTLYNITSLRLTGQSNVVLCSGTYLVSGQFSMSGQGTIKIAANSNGDPVILYVLDSAGSLTLTGQGSTNQGGAAALQVYGSNSTSAASITLTGQGALNATVYAPQSSVTLTGQGGVIGAVVAKSVRMTGNGAVTFDESLASANIAVQTTGGASPRSKNWRRL